MMNHRITESIITTRNADLSAHIAPMGIWWEENLIVLAPFRPSRTLDNIVRDGCAVVNFTDQVKVFAGCMTGRYDWPVVPANKISGCVLAGTTSHIELEVVRMDDDEIRPRFFCHPVFKQNCANFKGFNRAQSAVLELAILVSRLQMLPTDKIDKEVAYLKIAIEKTAGPDEREAWGWLIEKIAQFKKAKETQS